MKTDEELTCPYCGKTDWYYGIWLDESGNADVICNCGKTFVAKGKHVLTFTTFKTEDIYKREFMD